MTTKAPAPVELRDLTHLYCSDSQCNTTSCHCLASGLNCMELCSCHGISCGNCKPDDIVSESDDSDVE